MAIIDLVKTINKKMNKKKDMIVYEQVKFLNTFPEPRDDLERSYYQYACQNKLLKSVFIKIIRDILALFLIPIFLLLAKINSYKTEIAVTKEKHVFLFDGISTAFLPADFQKNTMVLPISNAVTLDDTVLFILKRIVFHKPFEFYFILKIFVKLLNYAYILKQYTPDKIISSCEYSYTSSILTWYCERKGIKHVNVMHGEKTINIREAFCRFSEFWVWDEHYIELFKKLRADESNFRVEIPPSFFINIDSSVMERKIDYKFYLQQETQEQLQKLKVAVDILATKGYSIKLRAHPLHSNFELLCEYFDENLLENPNEVDIKQSLFSSSNVVARYSTVLYQAYINGIPIVIDDYSNHERYKKLFDEDYIMLTKPHKVLSDILAVKNQ